MFKTAEDITKFIDTLEAFVQAVITNKFTHDVEDAVYLNKMRNNLQDNIEQLAGIVEKPIPTGSFACPECGSEMVVRTRRSDGNKFWGCKKYPECNGTRDSDGLSKAEKAKEREKVQQDAGFRFNRG